MPGPYVMGIDFGTESCRVAIFDLQGTPIGMAATPYGTSHPRPGWAEQSPDDWYLALQGSTAKDGQKVTVGVRPQDAFPAPGVKGTVFVYEDLMEYGLVRLDVHGTDKRVVVQTVAGAELRSGDIAEFNVSSHRVYLFDPEDGARIR